MFFVVKSLLHPSLAFLMMLHPQRSWNPPGLSQTHLCKAFPSGSWSVLGHFWNLDGCSHCEGPDGPFQPHCWGPFILVSFWVIYLFLIKIRNGHYGGLRRKAEGSRMLPHSGWFGWGTFTESLECARYGARDVKTAKTWQEGYAASCGLRGDQKCAKHLKLRELKPWGTTARGITVCTRILQTLFIKASKWIT